METTVIGLALGSGSARGWAHIGVIRALAEHGIEPQVVCGTSIGALVGAAYASGSLDALESWVRSLSGWNVVRYLDVRMTGGGLIQGERLMAVLRAQLRERRIEELEKPFAAVATDLGSGREVWLREGSWLDAARASMALPGLFAPVKVDGRWLGDGGLINPVPVSLCRALGANLVIAVDLSVDIVQRNFPANRRAKPSQTDKAEAYLARQIARIKGNGLLAWERKERPQVPGLLEVLAGAINIMQDRITRSRMAGDPPEVSLRPRLAHLGLMDYERAAEAIAEGHAATLRMMPVVQDALSRYGST